MKRVFNFSAGPAMLPLSVLEEAQKDLLDYKGSGMSVMEMSHRSKVYDQIIVEAEADLRKLLNIPANYKVLFLQGGGTQQFAQVPINLMKNKKADYIVSGHWSKKAAEEAAKYGDVKILATSADQKFTYVPDLSHLEIRPDADYVYMCENETIHGNTMWKYPDPQGKILVSDSSSCFLSRPMDVSQFGLIFAGAQKNVGPAGVTIVIVREDLLTDPVFPWTPIMLNYKIMAENNSMYNTPPCFAIYVCGLVFKYLLSIGGLETMAKMNFKKAQLLYAYLDHSKLFKGLVRPADRSLMNVTFKTPTEEMDDKFVKEAKAEGFDNLKGHRSLGGLRASIYNAMPFEGVAALVDFMKRFEAANL